MRSSNATLLISWLAIAVAAPIAGLLAGPRLRRAMSRRAIIILSIAAGSIPTAMFTPISFAGVLPDHLALMASYAWTWVLVGMLRSRIVRALIVGLPTLATVWIYTRDVSFRFFFVIVLSDLTELPQRTMSVGCGWTTRTTRVQSYGWATRSGYELSVSARPWGLPIEIELDRRHFDDYQYENGDRFSMSAGPSGCTTVIAYDGVEQWRVK